MRTPINMTSDNYNMNINKLVRNNILALTPYSTARDEFKGGDISVWLDANESPYDNGLNRYPDPHQKRLKEAIAKMKGVTPDRLFIGGAGSDEAIDLIYRIFCTPGVDNVVAISPTYGVYSVSAAINDVEYRKVPLDKDFGLSVEALLEAADSHTKVMWICSPNNPTGNAFDPKDIIDLSEKFNGIVVVDEAYIDFSGKGSMVPHIDAHPNIIVLQTLSKAWGLASMRLGIAIAVPEIARIMAMVKHPYNVNGPTQQAALTLIDRDIADQINEIVSQKEMLINVLPSFKCVKRVYDSDANFVLIKVDNANTLYDFLIKYGVIVRNRSSVEGCDNCLRLTVGTPEENARMLDILSAFDQSRQPSHSEIKHQESSRNAHVKRHTDETDIAIYLDLDGNPADSTISTGLKFFDHMLNQLPHHGGIRLDISCNGDLEVDEHHSMEDIGIALGNAIDKALGNKAGIERYGFV
ncbi:MAG: histidinol-phosphate transaminase, partial [Muribaculaceae bacterium]|nr:histidinol-phosphate transaminase [Muribaculaceae bacterium]